MSLFDSVISEVKTRFGLGDSVAGTLLSALLSLVTNEDKGGISGFLNMFSQAGLGDVASSWVNSGANTSVSNEQLESAVGASTIAGIAEKVGIPASVATSALGYMIPQIIDKLTPDGVVPENKDLLSQIGGYLTGWGGAAVTGAAGVVGAVAGGVGNATDKVGDAASATASAVGDTAKAGVTAASDTAKAGMNAVGNAFSSVGGAASDAVDDGGSILKWLLPLLLLGLLLLLGYWFCGRGPATTTTGNNANANKSNTNANANANVKPVVAPSVSANATDAEKNKAAEEALKNATDAKSIAAAMNISTINFATGKSDVPADAKELITEAAGAMKKLGSGEKIEVGGHTDNQGDAKKNLALSQARATSVMNALIAAGVSKDALSAKGYGSEKSIADNSTEDGRKKNRRIEYTAGDGTSVAGTTTTTTVANKPAEANANAKPMNAPANK